MPSFGSWRQSYAVVLVGTLAVVACADFFLYDHPLGWTAAIVAGLMLAVLSLRDTRFLVLPGGRIAWLAAAGLLVALVEQPTWLNIAYVVTCLGTLALVNTNGWDDDFLLWAARFARWIATGWTRLFRDNGVAMRWLVRRGLSPTLARGVAAWIIPAILASVFVAIFAVANPIISDWLSHLSTWIARLIDRLPELLDGARIAFWLVFATFAWSILRSRTSRRRAPTRAFAPPPPLPGFEHLEGINIPRHNTLGLPAAMVVRCLILFNLVFFVENVLDARYLFFAELPAGVSYTEYVHRGAYPLVAAALLAGAFVLVTFNPSSDTERSPWARRLVYLWITQTVFLTFTAAWRLVRYVAMSELTRLRMASAIWFGLVAIGLIYIIWRIVRGRDNRWLLNVNAVTAFGVLYACCFINFDGMITTFNARHCADVGGGGSVFSVDYAQHLGTPALTAIDSVKSHIPPSDPRRALAERASRELHAQLDSDLSDWHAWTWRRHRTAKAVKQLARARAGQQIAQSSPIGSSQ
jgi:hypothetical protein